MPPGGLTTVVCKMSASGNVDLSLPNMVVFDEFIKLFSNIIFDETIFYTSSDIFKGRHCPLASSSGGNSNH